MRELAKKSKPENFNTIRLSFLVDKIVDEQERFELETKHIFADFSKYLLSNRYKDATTFIGFMIWQLAINTQDFRSDAVICAVENKVSEQLKASVISAGPFRLDGEEIINALLQVSESKTKTELSKQMAYFNELYEAAKLPETWFITDKNGNPQSEIDLKNYARIGFKFGMGYMREQEASKQYAVT